MLQKYLNTLRRDSYTKQPLIEDCVTVTRDSAEEGAQRPTKYRAELAFPPAAATEAAAKGAAEGAAKVKYRTIGPTDALSAKSARGKSGLVASRPSS